VEVLRCPVCGHDGLDLARHTVRCEACAREYLVEDGVVDLAPPPPVRRGVGQRIADSNLYARIYDDVVRPRVAGFVSRRTLREDMALSAELLELTPASCVLDAGCGTGSFTRYFAQRMWPDVEPGAEPGLLVGMDVSGAMLDVARRNLRRDGLDDRVFLVRADMTHIPVVRGSFDRIHCAGALHLVDGVDEVLRNFARALAPDGICVISTVVRSRSPVRNLAERLVEFAGGVHWFGYEALHRHVERAGFEAQFERREGDTITIRIARR